jgi:eukaryotic-like serine/threonine-protein kinase
MTPDILWALPPSAQIRPLAVLKRKEIIQLQRYAPDDGGDLFVAHARGTRSRPVLLNEPTIELLRQFKTPNTVLAAVASFGTSHPLEPMPDAAAVLSALKGLIAAGLLVRADATNWLGTIAPSLRAGDRFEGYEVLRCVHCIEDAEVYEVRDLESGKHYALKRVNNPSPKLRAMLARERRALEQLEGTAACGLHQVIRGRGEALVLEWIGGAPLAYAVDRMHENGAPRSATLNLATNCVRAVASVHARGFVHGDLHPGNFLIDPAGMVRLVDFGLACRANRRPKAMPAAGVLAFIAPEHARAASLTEVSSKVASSISTDIYSLAAVLFFVFTGGPPIELPVGRSEALRAISTAPTRSFRSVGIRRWPAVERALAAALEKDPANRVGSADELLTALKRSSRFASGSSHDIAGLRAELHAYVTRSLTTLDGLSWPEFIRTSAAPHAGIAFGGAGIAYAFLRASIVERLSG